MENLKNVNMKKLTYIIFAFLLIGCSSGWHLKRAVKKNPNLLQMDTLVIKDTVNFHTERVEVDSTFIISNDTVVIIKDNMTIRHFIHNDTVTIWGECDTIWGKKIIERRIPYEKIVYNKSWMPPPWVIGLLVALLIIYAGKRLLDRFI